MYLHVPICQAPAFSVICSWGCTLSVCDTSLCPGLGSPGLQGDGTSFGVAETVGIIAVGYLNGLLPAASALELRDNVVVAMQALQEFGWVLNLLKYVLLPAQRLEYLELILDSERGFFFRCSNFRPFTPWCG